MTTVHPRLRKRRGVTSLIKIARLARDQPIRSVDDKTRIMNWYIAKIVFRICSEGSVRTQFDEHIRLISASDFDEAFLKARILGIGEEDAFVNDRNNTVKWEFINVSELYPLTELKDGSELYSSITEADEENNYIDNIHQRAIFMQTKERPVL